MCKEFNIAEFQVVGLFAEINRENENSVIKKYQIYNPKNPLKDLRKRNFSEKTFSCFPGQVWS